MHSVSARKAPEVSGSYPATRQPCPLTLAARSGSHRDRPDQLSGDSRSLARNGKEGDGRCGDAHRADQHRGPKPVDERLATRVAAVPGEDRGEHKDIHTLKRGLVLH